MPHGKFFCYKLLRDERHTTLLYIESTEFATSTDTGDKPSFTYIAQVLQQRNRNNIAEYVEDYQIFQD